MLSVIATGRSHNKIYAGVAQLRDTTCWRLGVSVEPPKRQKTPVCWRFSRCLAFFGVVAVYPSPPPRPDTVRNVDVWLL
jgi:hypothetical protein